MVELAKASGLSLKGLLGALEQLDANSLVAKEKGAGDKVVYTITEPGKQMLETLSERENAE